MKVLVGCEFSGVVRRAFRKLGHDAWGCDLLPAEDNSEYHIQTDIKNIINDGWDALIVFPTCTYLCSSGLHWNKRRPERQMETEKALDFIRFLLNSKIPKKALENPIGCISTRIRKPNQIIQPWQFGHPESKATCFWLENLPNLIPTNIISLPKCGRWENQTKSGQNKLAPSKTRWMDRSRTYPGIADAMALQWGVER